MPNNPQRKSPPAVHPSPTRKPAQRTSPRAYTRHVCVYICVYVCMCAQAKAQYDNLHLVSLDTLEAHLRLAYNQTWTAEREAYQYKLKGSWTKYVPNIGLTFGLPSISWSPNAIFETGNIKRQLKAKLKSIDLDYTNRLNKAIADLRIEYQKLQIQIQDYQQEKELFQIKTEIFEITENQNQNHEILPADYLNKKLEHLKEKTNLQKQKTDLLLKRLELYKFASYNLPNIQIFYTPNENCILLQKR